MQRVVYPKAGYWNCQWPEYLSPCDVHQGVPAGDISLAAGNIDIGAWDFLCYKSKPLVTQKAVHFC